MVLVSWIRQVLDAGGAGRALLILLILSVPVGAVLVGSRRWLPRLVPWANRVFRHGTARWLLVFATLSAPIAATVGLTHLYLHASPFDFVANSPNDFVDYWHEIATFRAVGFEGGYYTADEKPAGATFTRFGDHGPVYIVLVGSLAKLSGWDDATPVVYNMAFVTAGLALFIAIARPDGFQLLLTFVSVLVCWPILLLIPTSSQESLHQAAAVVIAAMVFGRDERNRPLITKGGWALATAAVIIGLSLMRYSWALLLIPVALLALSGSAARVRAMAALAAVLVIAITVWLSSFLASAGHSLVFERLSLLGSDPTAAVGVLIDVVRTSLAEYLSRPLLDCLVRLQMVALTLGVPIAFVLAGRRHAPTSTGGFFPQGWVHWFFAATILTSSLVLYHNPSLYRLFSLTVLFSWFGFIVSRHYTLALVAVATHLFLSPAAGSMMADWSPNFALDRAVLARDEQMFASKLRYAPPPASPWCNTIFLNWLEFDARVSRIPAGFGLSTFNPGEPPRGPVRSKYLLLNADEVSVMVPRGHFEILGNLAGNSLALVLNKQSECR